MYALPRWPEDHFFDARLSILLVIETAGRVFRNRVRCSRSDGPQGGAPAGELRSGLSVQLSVQLS